MCPHPDRARCHWDGSPRTTHPRRPLRVSATSPSRLLRTGQDRHCRRCGNRIDLYQRADQQPIALHPAELAATQVPEACRWHLSGGIAHPHGDRSDWCRISHHVICPHHTPTPHIGPYLQAMRRQLALHTRRLIDTGALTPATPTTPQAATTAASPARPVVQILLGRYLADSPVDAIQCVAQTRHRHRCPRPVLDAHLPAGRWKLLPTGPHRGQLTLPAGLMAVYDLGRLAYTEQLRWRTQRCTAHAAAPGAADLALAGWQVFDPLLHSPHIHTRLPHPAPGRGGKR
ncbi:DUF6083 domain-containing protein [Streptomyces sp. NPDC048751]|uniref:DUF6083 domain-containing protein n=1 Tax=Streptomyces sp. NPDC048751 TaxID=3365591 RepID=UPI0037179F0F